jgi:hypothetical protein
MCRRLRGAGQRERVRPSRLWPPGQDTAPPRQSHLAVSIPMFTRVSGTSASRTASGPCYYSVRSECAAALPERANFSPRKGADKDLTENCMILGMAHASVSQSLPVAGRTFALISLRRSPRLPPIDDVRTRSCPRPAPRRSMPCAPRSGSPSGVGLSDRAQQGPGEVSTLVGRSTRRGRTKIGTPFRTHVVSTRGPRSAARSGETSPASASPIVSDKTEEMSRLAPARST